jgi:hypothetical protein
MDQDLPGKKAEVENLQSSSATDKDLNLALELAGRAVTAKSVDEISFLLTNDLRTLSNFDRCFLITHLGSDTRITAATHQPILIKNTEIEKDLVEIATLVPNVSQPVILSNIRGQKHTFDEGITHELRTALESYIDHSGCTHLCLIPLNYHETIVAHLLTEYFGDNAPQKQPLMLTMKVAPIFAAMLTEQWLFEKKPSLEDFVHRESALSISRGKRLTRYLLPVVAIFALLLVFFFVIPVNVYVGGEAVIDPMEKQFAFCKIGGLLEEVYVNQGSHVEKGQVLARLDAKEIDHKIKKEERHFEILTQDITLLRTRAIDDPSSIARSKLLELERKRLVASVLNLVSPSAKLPNLGFSPRMCMCLMRELWRFRQVKRYSFTLIAIHARPTNSKSMI